MKGWNSLFKGKAAEAFCSWVVSWFPGQKDQSDSGRRVFPHCVGFGVVSMAESFTFLLEMVAKEFSEWLCLTAHPYQLELL